MELYRTGYRYFLAVAHSSSIRSAAEKLRISQSAVSRQIQLLEADIGATLLDRSARGVTITPEGELLVRYLNESNGLYKNFEQRLGALKGIQRGHLAIAILEGFASSGFPETLSTFTKLHPAVTLEVFVEGSHTVLAGVENDRFDVGVIFNPHSPNVDVVHRSRLSLCALMRPQHALANREMLSMSDLHGYPVVAPAGSGGSSELIQAAQRLAKQPIRVVLETNSSHVAAAFLARSDGVGILSDRFAATYIERKLLTAVRMREPILHDGYMAVIKKSGKTLSPAGQIMCTMLKQSVKKLEEWRV